jgi:hypothetical protein
MNAFDRWLLLTHAAATLVMVGVIWFVQIVHYPLFDRVGRAGFPIYAVDHQQRTLVVVGPTMLVELLTSLLLLIRHWAGPEAPWLWVGAGLLGVIWLSTAFLQVPRHCELAAGFDEEAHRLLVLTNWLRTGAWSSRGMLALFLIDRMMAG